MKTIGVVVIALVILFVSVWAIRKIGSNIEKMHGYLCLNSVSYFSRQCIVEIKEEDLLLLN